MRREIISIIFWKFVEIIFPNELDGKKPPKSNEVKHQHFANQPNYNTPAYLKRNTYCTSCSK